jgi:long-chain acyl-CoA synthetase
VLQIIGDIKPGLILVDDEERSRSMSNSVVCLSAHQLRVFIAQCRVSASLNDWRIESRFQENDIANILFTSGTTSAPKGVMLSHRNLVRNALAKLDAMPQLSSDHRLNLLPFSHAYAKTCELATWLISGSSLEIATSSSDLIERFAIAKPTLFNGVPLLFKRIHAEWLRRGGGVETMNTLTGGRIRQFASGGAPIHDELRAAFEQSGLPIFQGYGLTEAGPVVCSNRSGANSGGVDRCLVGVGPVVNGVELRIDRERRLWVRGDGVMLGYWNDPGSTGERIQNGWLDTGDVAALDESQNVSILGRSDDTIILENGYKIDPLGIEQLICNIEGVRDCALVSNEQSGYDVVILCEEMEVGEDKRKRPWKTDIECELSRLFSQHRLVHPQRVVFSTVDWTEKNGLRNFKGAKNRSKIKLWVTENRYDI